MQSELPSNLVNKIPVTIINIFSVFQKAGFEIYLIGAGTRNLLLGKKIVDPDFTTNATPEEIQKLFPDSFYDNQFGTVGIKIGDEVFEITTYRTEQGYSDRRHPDKVSWGKTLEEDLSRRELTISSVAVGPNKNNQLEIVDLYGGMEDLLKNHLVKTVDNPSKRFSEDALRMMRAIRIATQLSFTIEPKTFQAIQENAGLINQIAAERIKIELFKILKSDYPADGFTLLLSSELLEQILPELMEGYGMAQAKHHIYDVWTHSLMALKFCPSSDPLVRFATLLHDVGKPAVAKGEGEARTFYNHEVVGTAIASRIADRLRFSKDEKNRLLTLIRWHQFTVDEHQTDSAIRRFITNVGKQNLQDMLDLRVGDRLGGGARETSWRLEEFKKRLVEVQKQPFSINDLKINGNDVMKTLGIKPGPKVGEILNKLFEEVVEDKKRNTRKYLMERIKELG
ncbi:hypothetical protein COT44_00265 [Candidatus Shapirobacteria bacterium CG08_land_8_20_14_0_20_39_18]|uniref:CCA tRNA nucleotidyltransferase n=1 Tax=Candidatus Shapirobacteria bacterium CG08_land_8_20_14_0_20_39_18 TaxID=1974883 RepID=A0A2M6XE62_9BACT|nr:MAG: hypothetical protein COT44_00265 [Candidatus Shapirobacteria bacterium CG08_land_8_20_14_0_20_39_18]PIY64702.1 MAG: hypothetical protein COY91_04505 [Candidatus Shapirobacteria bacterium CG_4_10_14_0_8_um_filter_39_15]PJE68769.1 MAG: hypothetical protein COU94_00420 [Candidatus Shapirobacteria bacterium CG10_big_fil_rev_8_21_14_0_10_38_8]